MQDPNILCPDANIVVALRIRKNTLTEDELKDIFPSAVANWVWIDDVNIGPPRPPDWVKPEDRPVAEVQAKFVTEQHQGQDEIWWQTVSKIKIPKIQYSTLRVLNATEAWNCYFGHFGDHLFLNVALIWSDAECVE